jgi:hypothetical protein
VTKKFSLKDNPIFQRLAPPTLQEKVLQSRNDEQAEQVPDEGQTLTVIEGPSEFDPQNLTLRTQGAQSPPPPTTREAMDQSIKPESTAEELELRDHLDKSLFFSFYNEVSDELLPMLDPTEQVLYSRLFRLSYGFNRNYCTVSQPLLMERTGLSRNTVRTGLQSLLENGWIKIVGAGNRVSTSYRVVLPREKETHGDRRGAKSDPLNLRLKNRPSKVEGQILPLKSRGSDYHPPEDQFSALQNLTGNIQKDKNANLNNDLKDSPSKSDPQNLPPLLRSVTNRSLTLSQRETGHQNLTSRTSTLSARELVEKFYSLLGQRASKTKQEKSIQDCLSLLKEGFTVEEVDYAISWIVKQHPTTGAFSRLMHFIDQALKERQELSSHSLSQQQTSEREKEGMERQRMEEEEQQRQQVAEAKAALSSVVLHR